MAALAFVAAMVTVVADDPAHFPDPYDVGAYVGPTPRLFQSGEVADNGRISKGGDGLARHRLYEAAHSLLVRVKDGPAPKVRAARLARHVGPKKARVAGTLGRPDLPKPCCGGPRRPAPSRSRSDIGGIVFCESWA